MDIATIMVLALLISATKESTIDGCPPADPNCHPSCIVYTADHCRYCMCKDGMGSSSSSSSGSSGSGFGSMSSDAAWDRGFEEGDWSSKMNADSFAWSNSGGGGGYSSAGVGSSSGSKEETVKYVIVEKEPEPQIPSYTGGGGPIRALPNPFSGGMSSPFGSMNMPSSLLPGSNNIVDSHLYGSNVIHVPLLAPGIPKYCVRCKILSCPGTCERTDEYGCKSCPCAPSRYQTMPVLKDCSEPDVFRPDCSATKLCIESCRDGYQLGEVGRDGCQSCTCIRRAQTTLKPEAQNCPATLKCMLQCKDGYLLGDKQGDGCPSCKCLLKGMNTENNEHSSNNNNMASNNNNIGSNNWGGNSWEKNGGQNSMNSGTGTGTGSGCSGKNNNYLSSTNGIGSGKCEPPMCLSGHMSIDEAMNIGAASAGGGARAGGGCDEGNSAGTGVMDMGSFAGMSSSNSGGSSSSSGGFNMGGGFGSGGGMTGGGSGGASASGSGMPSPFSVSMSGAGAGGGMGMGMGMGMGGGGGGGKGGSGMPFSPFSSAMSGGGPGMGMSGSSGMGGMRGGASSAMGTETAVSAVAYNKDCIGAECSAKNGMQHKDCPDLIHCLVTCDGKQMLGELDANGCQTCTCT